MHGDAVGKAENAGIAANADNGRDLGAHAPKPPRKPASKMTLCWAGARIWGEPAETIVLGPVPAHEGGARFVIFVSLSIC